MPPIRKKKKQKTKTIPYKKYCDLVKKAELWEHWGEKAQWETDNYGQVILYTDRDKDGEPMDWDKIEEEE